MDETRLDKIEIKELEVFANHGVYPEENVLGQKFVISATLFTRTRLAGLTDELSASINYGEVSHMITDFTRKHTYKLLESLAENLAEMLLCSLSGLIDPAENEEQVAAFLARHPEFRVVRPAVAFPDGMTVGEHGALSVPTRTGMDGFFLCAMQKTQ